MADIKQYTIKINGLQESIDAVDALNKQLDALDKRISALQSRHINIGTTGGSSGTGGSGKSSRANALSEEEKLLRQIEQTENKIKAYSKDVYQNYMASKEQLKETLEDQKQIAAQERLQANTYSNTMKGLKQQLADIKQVMQTTEIGSDIFKKYTAEANEITNKLKELEEAYGQFGRNVGNYKSAADGFKQLEIEVNGVVRSFSNAREAYRTLKNERDTMALMGQRETKQFKELDETVKTLSSDMKDMSKSSAFMDNMLDTMTSFSAMAGIGVGLSQLFGFDDEVFSDSMQKLTSLLLIVKSFETLAEQWQSNEGLMGKLFKPMAEGIDKVFDDWVEKKRKEKKTKLQNEFDRLTKELEEKYPQNYRRGAGDKLYVQQETEEWENYLKYAEELDKKLKNNIKTVNLLSGAFKALGKVLLTLGGIFATFVISELLDKFTDFVKSLNTAKIVADAASQSMNRLTKQFEEQRDILGASYLKGEISANEYLNSLYEKQSALLAKQIELLKERSKGNEYNGLFGTRYMSDRNTEFSGKKFEPTTVGAGTISSMLGLGNDLEITVKSIEDVEKAWKHCFDAVKKEQDAFDGISWWGSLVTTVKDTEKVMKGMGNIKLSDFINQFGELNRQLKNSEISADDYAKELAKLKKEMNSNEVLSSVIANLDKYIPDEEVRKDIQSIIDKIRELDDTFNMTSPQQIHHWNQVRIDAMKDGLKKTLAQIDENQRYEIQQEAKTDEQRKLIEAKYQRQRLDAQEKAGKEAAQKAKENNKKIADAENQLTALRIENMKNGLKKRLAELDNQRRLELAKVKENGVKVGELSLEINKKYDRLIVEEKRKWAYDMLKTYEDLAERINQLNKATFDIEVSTANQNIDNRTRSGQSDTGYQMITPTNYDDSKNLEEYYRKIVDIKKKAAEREFAIEQERLDKQLDYDKKEEELRHKRLLDENGGEYITQLRAGLITQEEYDKLIEDENDAHYARMNALDKQYASNLSAATEDSLEKTQKLYSDFYGNVINNLRRDRAKVDEVMTRQPVTDTAGWGVVNIGKTSQNYTNALAEYDKIKQEILKKQSELEQDLKNHNISAEDFAIRQEDLKNEIKAIDEACKSVKESQKMLIADFLQSMQQYIQAGMESFNTIMQAIWDAQDNQFDKEADAIDKLNEELDKKLDEQQEIVEKHKDAIDSIEDELSTARGDRRQHLIDQLNAEMEAQREARKQEQKIQKEKEAAQKKQDALELKRKKAQYHRDMLQAIVNGAMAVTYAAMNSWPIPAIPMMALAAATTAAQVAIMASNKPYAKGGLLEGKSHAQGGIPIPGTGIEVEGKEYVIRKKSTAPNIDVLDYINKSERKLTLDDFIDFYSTGKVRKNISSISPSRRFADGGTIPSLSTDIDINDRLLNTMEAYANRPVVVSVVDINNRQAAVKNVQVLAGIEK